MAELARIGVQPVSSSSLYLTQAWPDPDDPPFVNAAACIETTFTPSALLHALEMVECSFGRTRSTPNAPRTLDLDLLDYNGLVQEGPPILPHPRMHERRFVLEPLADIVPDWSHPVSGITLKEMLAALPKSENLPVRLALGLWG